ncbi:MAG: hypothetical protein HY690_07440 [Chloroflexi bacterium]|nr:hypothetical protein [Chloroflexota bacterium]
MAGQNRYCQVLTSPLATVYRTTPARDRLTVLDVLRSGRARTFLLNEAADQRLAAVDLAPRTRRGLACLPRDTVLDEPTRSTGSWRSICPTWGCSTNLSSFSFRHSYPTLTTCPVFGVHSTLRLSGRRRAVPSLAAHHENSPGLHGQNPHRSLQ